MIISDFHIYQYNVPFVHPIRMLNRSLTTRPGLLVQLLSEDGSYAFGDVPPFPGLSDETIEHAIERLATPGHDFIAGLFEGKRKPGP